MKHINLFDIFSKEKRLNEIADRIIDPIIVNKSSSGSGWVRVFYYDIVIRGNVYKISIQLIGKEKYAIQIDFGISLGEFEMSNELTNSNIMLEVMSNLVGVFKQWLKDYKGNDVIQSFIITGKSEFSGDHRRSSIYDAYIKKILGKLGVNVIETLDITDDWNMLFSINTLGRTMKYVIEPITLDKMRLYK